MQNLKEFREAGAKRFQKKEIAAALGIVTFGLSLFPTSSWFQLRASRRALTRFAKLMDPPSVKRNLILIKEKLIYR